MMGELSLKGTMHSGHEEYLSNQMVDGEYSRVDGILKGTTGSGEEVVTKMEELSLKGTLRCGDALKGTSDRGDEVVTSRPIDGHNMGVDKKRVPYNFLKGLRLEKWKEAYQWDENDLDRQFLSTDVLPEMLQDYEANMVLIGIDVVNLYPSLEVEKVVDEIREAVKMSSMKWEEFDYREGVRYLALNWDHETCMKSNLRRVLPTKRDKRGTRPGVKGAGPRGKDKGDKEQWIFRDVVLKDWEKQQIVAEVVSLATKSSMFRNHYYKFGGKMYHQAQGGPIGLHGTCAIARMVMQLFDIKWGDKLKRLGIVSHMAELSLCGRL